MSLFGTRRKAEAGALPVEGRLPGFEAATGWLNSTPLRETDVHGKVVLADFWTYTCINWLRTLGYLRAWAEKYEEHGLVVVGIHTPEFPFEHDLDNVREAVRDLRVEYPVALDNDYAVWDAFRNRYWPAVYIADAQGRIRHHQFGEGGYEECEWIVQQLLREAGGDGIGDDLVSVVGTGFEVQADWTDLESPETYLGYRQAEHFASPGGAEVDEPSTYVLPETLELNRWALAGNWTIASRAAVSNETGGRIAFRFHARDVNLVLAPGPQQTVPIRVLVDGEPPGDAHGLDVDEEGRGTLARPRVYQLIRERGSVTDRTFEITFLAPGAEAYVFTFG